MSIHSPPAAASVKAKPRQAPSRRDLHCCLAFGLGVSGSSRRGRFMHRDKTSAAMVLLESRIDTFPGFSDFS